MALVSVTEIQDSRTAKVDDNNQRQYTRVFMVVFDSPADGALAALTADGVPIRGDTFEDAETGLADTEATCREKSAEQVESTIYKVTVSYDTKTEDIAKDGGTSASGSSDPSSTPPGGTSNNANVAPDSRVPSITFGTKTVEEVFRTDYTTPTALPILNSAGMPYDPPEMVTRYLSTISITTWKSSWAVQKKFTYEGTTNAATYTILGWDFPAKSLIITSYGVKSAHDSFGDYWEITIEFLYDPNLHVLKLLDAGMWEAVVEGADTFYVRICDKLGNPLDKPVPLDGTGAKAGPNLTVYNLHQKYKITDWSAGLI